MITRKLGSSGIETSAIGIGCWAIGGPDNNLGLPMGWGPIDDREISKGLETAYELGATLYDTADIYGHGRSERAIGELVSHIPRSNIVLSSKVGYFAGTAPHGYSPHHMRHQLEQTLENLRTDYLDIYFFHHADFGPEDEYLEGAVETIREFKNTGVIRSIGMRGPHRFVLDRISKEPKNDKHARFYQLFERIQPEILAVRDNLLTPADRSDGIFRFADEHHCGVLINKPLAQGLLTGTHNPTTPRVFGAGDHRSRKRWFTPDALTILTEGLNQARRIIGPASTDLIRTALWSCLDRSPNAAVLVGFTTAEQVTTNMTCVNNRPTPRDIEIVREIMSSTQRRLDDLGEVFLDESTTTR